MSHFTISIQTSIGSQYFFFNKIFTSEGVLFHISVVDQHRKNHFFNMRLNDKKWFIVDESNVPDWIVELEDRLSELINENYPTM